MGFHKARNVIGVFLVFFHNGPYYYWGILSIYITSYLVSRANSTVGQIYPAWAMFAYGPFWALSMLAGGYLNNYIHERFIIFASILVLSCSFFVSYLMVDDSLNVLFIAFGVFVGIGSGTYEGVLLQNYVVNQSPRHTALITGIVLAGSPLGGIIMGQFATWFINPENLTPDSSVQGIDVFTQEHIVGKVPTLLLILGASTITLQLIGFLLLSNSKTCGGRCFGNEDSDPKESDELNGTIEYTDGRSCSEGNVANCRDKDSDPDYAPCRLFKSLDFYKLVGINFLTFFPSLVVFSYYKIYGQVWIRDDHFLTYLGTLQSLVTIPGYAAWSALLDRLSVRSTCVCMYSGTALSILLMYFTARWNKWAYAVASLLATLMSLDCVCFMILTLRLYGNKNFSTNIAILELVTLIGTIIPGIVFDPMIDAFGYFAEFASASVFSIAAMLIMVLYFPDE